MTEAEKQKRRKEIREALAKSRKTGGTGFTKQERPGLGMNLGIGQVTTDASGKVKIKRPAQLKKEAAKKPSNVPNLRKDRTKLNVNTPTLGATPSRKSKVPDQVKNKPPKKTDPLAGKPRSIAAAKRAGQLYFFDKNGVKKLAVTKEDLKRTGLSLREYANKFAPKKVTKKEAEKFKKKAGGGMMKKKGAKAGGAMKKKGAAGGGKMRKKMTARGGGTMRKKMTAKAGGKMKKKMTAKAGGAMKKKMTARGGGAMKKKMYAGGGKMNKKMARAGGKMKKGYAVGGAMKKKGMKKGGKTMKMRGGGLATRGTTFRIR